MPRSRKCGILYRRPRTVMKYGPIMKVNRRYCNKAVKPLRPKRCRAHGLVQLIFGGEIEGNTYFQPSHSPLQSFFAFQRPPKRFRNKSKLVYFIMPFPTKFPSQSQIPAEEPTTTPSPGQEISASITRDDGRASSIMLVTYVGPDGKPFVFTSCVYVGPAVATMSTTVTVTPYSASSTTSLRPTSTPVPRSKPPTSLSAGAAAGISIGATLLVVLLAFLDIGFGNGGDCMRNKDPC